MWIGCGKWRQIIAVLLIDWPNEMERQIEGKKESGRKTQVKKRREEEEEGKGGSGGQREWLKLAVSRSILSAQATLKKYKCLHFSHLQNVTFAESVFTSSTIWHLLFFIHLLMHIFGHIISVVSWSHWVYRVLQQTPSSRQPNRGRSSLGKSVSKWHSTDPTGHLFSARTI